MQVLVIGAGVVGLPWPGRPRREATRSSWPRPRTPSAPASPRAIPRSSTAACITRPGRCGRSTASPAGACSTPSAPRMACRTRKCGKLIVATSDAETAKLEQIAAQGAINGVEGLTMLTRGRGQARSSRRCNCTAALLSPETGIVSAHDYMLALRGDHRGCRRRHRLQHAGHRRHAQGRPVAGRVRR